MAATTVTASTVVNEPREIHEGNFSVYFKYNVNGTTISTGDIIMMGYIPQGVTVLDGYIWGTISSAGTVDVGTSASISALCSAITLSAAGMNRCVAIPRQFSLSADAEGKHRIGIFVKAAAVTSTVTGSLNMLLICSKDVTV